MFKVSFDRSLFRRRGVADGIMRKEWAWAFGMTISKTQIVHLVKRSNQSNPGKKLSSNKQQMLPQQLLVTTLEKKTKKNHGQSRN